MITNRIKKLIATAIGTLACLFSQTTPSPAENGDAAIVDFRYSPPEWQTLICLADDPCKTLVDRNGELLYHYGQGGREFGATVAVEATSNMVWQKQELQSSRVPIVRTCFATDGLVIVEEAFAVTELPQPIVNKSPGDQGLLSGNLNTRAAARLDQATTVDRPSRNDVVLVHVTNAGNGTRTFAPKLVVDTALGCRLEDQRVVVNNHERVTCSLKMAGLVGGNQVQLEPLTLAAGHSVEFFALYSSGSRIVTSPSTVKQAVAARDRAIKYWEKVSLPYGHVLVPDAGIQALVDSSIRNIWQAREIKNGMTAFQVGPTCYRGLWIVDGAFLLEAAAILGAGGQARDGVAYELTRQKADGRIEVMENYWKENGIVLWTCVRHAQLTQDKAWLQGQWPKLERIAEFIRTLRQQTLKDDSPLDDGLIPPGFPDGGIGGVQYEYTNPYWNLAGLRSFVEAARWLGKADEAIEWQKEYDDFMAAFRKAATRDMRKDTNGNSFLPILMGDAGGKGLPQRAQWAFCQAVYPGQLFAKEDPLVAGNMAMLEATEREGMVCGTGWDATGIWNYFASFYGHAWLWQGNGRKASRLLYAYANHAAPVLDWREEQSLRGEKFRKVGDMPHNWASAEFVRLTVHLLEMDRGRELHLFEGLPLEWTKPGMVTRLNGIATPFGKLTMELKIAADGKAAHLRVEPLTGAACQKIIVHLGGWASGKKDAAIELDPGSRNDRTILLAPDLSTATGQ